MTTLISTYSFIGGLLVGWVTMALALATFIRRDTPPSQGDRHDQQNP